MLRNYFKTAWRNLVKNRFYSLIHMAGLSIGLAVGLLVLLWVQDELSFDKFHHQGPDIYRLTNRVGTGDSRQIWTSTASAIGYLAKKELPEVKEAVRLSNNWQYQLFKYQDKVFKEDKTSFADPAFFSLFDFPLVKGNAATPFPDDHSIVLTATTARKYFGDADPMGKVITANDTAQFKVSGIIKDFPENASFRFDMLLPMTLHAQNMYTGNKEGRNLGNDFIQYNYNTFLLLRPGTSLAALSTKLRNIHLGVKADDTDVEYLLQPIGDMHLYLSDGTPAGIETVRLFMVIALLILAVACINYVNLSTARSLLRAKEISMRKIVGASKKQLFIQFVVETTLLFIGASAVGLLLVYLVMPYFNQLAEKQLTLDITNHRIWLTIVLTVIGTLAASSIYPALLLSSFEPLKALKGKITARISDKVFRKILVVTQFSFSIVLIAGTLIITRQLQYIHNKQLGYDKAHVFAFNMGRITPHYLAAQDELRKQPGVLDVTTGADNIVDLSNQTGDNHWDGKAPTATMMVYPVAIDEHFIPFFKLQLTQGSNFTGSVADSTHFILNETAVQTAGITNPIGKRFKLWKQEGTIIGVAKDFHFASLKEKIQPAVFYYHPQDNGVMFVKTNGSDAASVIAAAQQLYKQYNGDFPFSYAFLDDSYNRLYKDETRTGQLFNLFAGIAIFISCLGLFGLAAYTAQVRTREIGVRKVLGATVAIIIQLLVKDFIELVLIAIVIAVPVAWYIMHHWLQQFAYKTTIGYAVFIWSALIAVFIALATISYQSIKAALANPAKSLKTE